MFAAQWIRSCRFIKDGINCCQSYSEIDSFAKGRRMPKAESIRVLCVDDQESMLRLHRYAFAQLGIRNVTEVTSAVSAIDMILKSEFDLVTLDWNMPGTDGLTLFKMLRKHPQTAKLPIIMVTGNAEESSVKTAIAAGVRLFLRKPVSVRDLKVRVEAAIGKLT
ncbi:response regulator [Azospirillum isscasi]|nr:response regulator [Azospirillum isscasi]